MRPAYWLLLVNIGLFVFGVGFIVVGARSTRQTAPVDGPVMTPVASTKQIMNGIMEPAALAVWSAVSTTVTKAGVEEKAPQSAEEWATLGNSAAALVEAGNLLMMGSRAVDRAAWLTMSRAMAASATAALKAADAKSADGILAAGETLTASCDTCHERYQRR